MKTSTMICIFHLLLFPVKDSICNKRILGGEGERACVSIGFFETRTVVKTDYRFGVIDSVNPQFGVVKVLLPNSDMRTVNECASVSLPRERVTDAEGKRNELFMNFSEKRTLEFVSDFPPNVDFGV